MAGIIQYTMLLLYLNCIQFEIYFYIYISTVYTYTAVLLNASNMQCYFLSNFSRAYEKHNIIVVGLTNLLCLIAVIAACNPYTMDHTRLAVIQESSQFAPQWVRYILSVMNCIFIYSGVSSNTEYTSNTLWWFYWHIIIGICCASGSRIWK